MNDPEDESGSYLTPTWLAWYMLSCLQAFKKGNQIFLDIWTEMIHSIIKILHINSVEIQIKTWLLLYTVRQVCNPGGHLQFPKAAVQNFVTFLSCPCLYCMMASCFPRKATMFQSKLADSGSFLLPPNIFLSLPSSEDKLYLLLCKAHIYNLILTCTLSPIISTSLIPHVPLHWAHFLSI